jgi:hypothetical protein
MKELLELKKNWENILKESIKLNAPKGEKEMILWFISDIDKILTKQK